MDHETQEVPAIVKAHQKPWFYATKPTRGTVFLRTFLPWQIIRFIKINLKMMAMIRRSHGSQ
ncbi:MAG: hypothetical protein IPJ98_20090 [Bryobacterales bacterium]|nr:hypothetical protein [Bryobacterales bacterium]